MPNGQVQPSAHNVNQINSHFPTSLQSLLAINIRNQDSNSFHHMTPQGSVIFHTRQWFNVRMLGSPIGQTSPYRGVSSLHLVGWIFTSPVPSSYPSLRF